MARLQKKQSPEAKRKKKQKTEEAEAQSVNGIGAPKPVGSAGGLREIRKKPAPAPKKAAAGSARTGGSVKAPNFVNQSIQFLREVKVELKKVAWPTRKQTVGSTAVVIVLVMIISLFLGVVDFGLNSLIRIVLQ